MSRSNRKQRTKQALRRRSRESRRLAKQHKSSVGRDNGSSDSLMISCALCWDKVPKTDILRGTVWGVTGSICKECIDYVGNDEFKESLTPAVPTSNSYAYSSVDDWDWGIYGSGAITNYVSCSHHMTPFSFEGMDNTYTVHLTGSSSLKSEPGIKDLPTVGVYLDDGWLYGRLATNTAHEVDLTQPCSLYVGWQDFGTIKVSLLSEAVEWVLPFLRDRKSIIEIACIGGHGRTGTFVTALMIREGWAVTDAIEYIRGGYCPKAIEGPKQEELLQEYYNLINGVEADESADKQLHQA